MTAMSTAGISIWSMCWLVAIYGQTAAPVGAAGRLILMLPAGIAAAVNVGWLMPQARALRANNATAWWIHGTLLLLSTVLLAIHFVGAFQQVYASTNSTIGVGWVDFLLIALPATMLIVIGVGWPVLPIFRPSKSTTMVPAQANDSAVPATQTKSNPGRSIPSTDQRVPAGRSNSAPQKAAAPRSARNPAPDAGEKADRATQGHAEQAPSTSARSLAQTARAGMLVIGGFVCAMAITSSPVEDAQIATCWTGPIAELSELQKSSLTATAPPKASTGQKAVGQPAPKATQKSPRTSRADGNVRHGVSRAPP